MKRIAVLCLATALLLGCGKRGQEQKPDTNPASAFTTAPAQATVQEPQVAGQFYPADPNELASTIRGFIQAAQVPNFPGRVFGLIVPHAGIKYSGPVAGYAYQLLQRRPPRRVVVIGAAHRNSYPGIFALDLDQYRTPLGLVKIDRAGVARLKTALPWVATNEVVYRGEHSAEVQLPFLQESAGSAIEVVVLMMGQNGPEVPAQLAAALDASFPGDDTVFIASTDMSHGNYPPFKNSDQIRPVDIETLRLIEGMKIDELRAGLIADKNPLCGGPAVLTLMELFKRRGGGEVRALRYADSGDVTGDHSQVVGYGAVAFLQPEKPGAAAAPTFSLSEDEKKELLKMARAFAESAVRRQDPPKFEPSTDNLRRSGAAFVTLKRRGELAGCIGSIIATEPLYLCVQRRAVDAATNDSRFFSDPITPAQLPDVKVEISVLTPPVPTQPADVQVGRDGVLLTLGQYRGVFLPQVPVEQGWNREEYLSHICGKAGHPDPGCWRSPEAKLEKFEAIVFSEDGE